MSVFNDNSSDLQIWDNAAFDCGDSIDKEIEDVEKEINQLSCRLLELKRERNARTGERRGRVVFLEQDKSWHDEKAERLKKLEDSLTFSSAGSVNHERKGLIVGQSEIISAGAMARRMIKKMDAASTPLNQNRKSCFWKLDQIDELKMTKERGKRFSLSPRSTKAMLKMPKQAATTIASRKTWSKMDEKVSSSVLQPKKLFEEPVKKNGVKAGRIVASKYNTGLRKRSLPENHESKGNERKRASLGVKSSSKPVEQQCSRVKKKWDIPTKVVVYNSSTDADDDVNKDDDQTPPTPKGFRCIEGGVRGLIN